MIESFFVSLFTLLSIDGIFIGVYKYTFMTLVYTRPCTFNIIHTHSTQRGAYLMSDAYGLALSAVRLGLPTQQRTDITSKFTKKKCSILPKMTFNRMVSSAITEHNMNLYY